MTEHEACEALALQVDKLLSGAGCRDDLQRALKDWWATRPDGPTHRMQVPTLKASRWPNLLAWAGVGG